MFVAASSCLIDFRQFAAGIPRRGSGIFAPAIAAPPRDAACLAHFLSGGMWLSDRNDAEL